MDDTRHIGLMPRCNARPLPLVSHGSRVCERTVNAGFIPCKRYAFAEPHLTRSKFPTKKKESSGNHKCQLSSMGLLSIHSPEAKRHNPLYWVAPHQCRLLCIIEYNLAHPCRENTSVMVHGVTASLDYSPEPLVRFEFGSCHHLPLALDNWRMRNDALEVCFFAPPGLLPVSQT